MGVKAIREKYNIGHIVAKHGENIHIGSAYINDIIVINPEGKLIKKYKEGKYTNPDLKRYQDEMLSDPDELKRLFHLADEFRNLLPVFTHKKGRVISTYCEEYGWPKTTIEGEMMYDNTYFKTYKKAYLSCLENTKLKYDWQSFNRNVKDHITSIGKQFKWFFESVCEWIIARTISYMVYLIKK